MRKRVSLAALAIISLLLLILLASFLAQQPSQALDRITYQRIQLPQAPAALKVGDIDAYMFGLRGTQAAELANDPAISLYVAPSGMNDIDINPAPAPSGQLNPLSIREVRYALNFLIDRDLVCQNVFRGFCAPMYTFISEYDPDILVIFDVVQKHNFRYDPDLAFSMIEKAMVRSGAVFREGKWTFNNNPITLKFIIRNEDERREIGDVFAAALEKIGFSVDRNYLSFGPALSIVQGTNPADLQWHLYTAGWGKTGVNKYDSGTINQMGTAWFGALVGYQQPGWWWHQTPEIDILGQRVFTGDFKSPQERNELYAKATDLIMQDSVRIWVNTRLDAYPARKNVEGVTGDVGAGLRSLLNVREMFVRGKDELKIGHLWIWTARTVWNTYGGLGDVYSVDIQRATTDPTITAHPFNGDRMPFRVSYEVQTAGPEEKMAVPQDAVLWNASSKSWEPVGDGVGATSKAIFDYTLYFQSKWHHGQPITLADLLFSIQSGWDLTFDPTKSSLEGSIARPSVPYYQTIKGYRIMDNNRVEVYGDFWHFDEDFIADYLSPRFPANPWEIMLAQEQVVFNKNTAAFSETAATARSVPQLSLVLRDHADMVKNSLDELSARSFFPANIFTVGGRTYETSETAQERYAAATRWLADKGHIWISNGPFYLQRFDPEAQFAEIRAFKDPTYPFSKGKWYFGLPTTPELVGTDIPALVSGKEATVTVTATGPEPLRVRLLIFNATTGELLIKEEGTRVTSDRFAVRLSTDQMRLLKPGSYRLSILVYSEAVAFTSQSTTRIDVTG